MAEFIIKLPDVGEGVAEAELVEWNVKPGDFIAEDAIVGAVMTDKATVEIPSPVAGTVLWLGAEIGEKVATGAALVRLETDQHDAIAQAATHRDALVDTADEEDGQGTLETRPIRDAETKTPKHNEKLEHDERLGQDETSGSAYRMHEPVKERSRPRASPAVRLRASEAGIDLRRIQGSGPAGRVVHADIDTYLATQQHPASHQGLSRRHDSKEIKVVGLRRLIAEKMQQSKAHIPHITYCEEIDMTEVETLRSALNEKSVDGSEPKLTLLPFIMQAMVKAIDGQPQINAHFDDGAGVLRVSHAVHIGIATQTPAGLMVPVVQHVEARTLWGCAGEIARLSQAAKAGTATRTELTGSTITLSSLGSLGGIMSTPIINYPEVAIIGVNKLAMRPVWNGQQFIARKMMNLSSAFDHRVIDGYDAAVFVQRIKALLETPAMLFVEG
ncbi:dihydrolipoamide acetyltransferase family protein [Bartonella sp. LJL80]